MALAIIELPPSGWTAPASARTSRDLDGEPPPCPSLPTRRAQCSTGSPTLGGDRNPRGATAMLLAAYGVIVAWADGERCASAGGAAPGGRSSRGRLDSVREGARHWTDPPNRCATRRPTPAAPGCPATRTTGWTGVPRRRPTAGTASHRTDRKSTRLNSSHMSISYAVFCLKKKTTTHLPGQLLQPPTHHRIHT